MSSVNHKTARQRTADRIKASKLMTRLQKFALSGIFECEDDPEDLEEYKKLKKEWDKKQMTNPQVTAAFKLLGKVVPDLKQIEGKLKVEAQITEVKRTIVDP